MLNGIIAGIAKALGTTFGDEFKVYKNDVKQGLTEPCFFIATLKPEQQPLLGDRALWRNPFDIHYFPKDGGTNAELYDVAEHLMYLSQYLANFYLSYFDHWLKEELGLKYVVRYMDDLIIFSHSKQYLHWVVDRITAYLRDELNLEMKGNWQVFPTATRGVDFVGYRFFRAFTLLRKKTCKRFKSAMIAIRRKWEKGNRINYRQWCTINSYKGWLKWCDSFRLAAA